MGAPPPRVAPPCYHQVYQLDAVYGYQCICLAYIHARLLWKDPVPNPTLWPCWLCASLQWLSLFCYIKLKTTYPFFQGLCPPSLFFSSCSALRRLLMQHVRTGRWPPSPTNIFCFFSAQYDPPYGHLQSYSTSSPSVKLSFIMMPAKTMASGRVLMCWGPYWSCWPILSHCSPILLPVLVYTSPSPYFVGSQGRAHFSFVCLPCVTWSLSVSRLLLWHCR